MEENGMMEWEIVEYSANSPLVYNGDEDEINTHEYENDEKMSKLGWIWKTGLSLGKKVVITGVVISSVPLLLPPLVAISALGCALSIPFGFIFASYACTDKLMTKLLSPRPLMLLEYDPEQEQVVAIEYQDTEEREEKEAIEDAVESRFELVEDHDGDGDNLDVGVEITYTEEETQQQTENGNLMGPKTEIVGYVNDTKIDDDVAAAPEIRNTEDDAATSEVQIDKFTVENEGGEKVVEKEEDRFSLGKNENVEKITVAAVKGKAKKNAKGKNNSKEIEKRGKRKNSSSLAKFPGKRREPDGDERHEELSREEKGAHKKIETSGENNNTKQDLANSSDRKILLDEGIENSESPLEKEEKHVGVNNENNTIAGALLVSEIGVGVVVSDEGVDKIIEHRAVTVYNDPGEKYNQSKKIDDAGEYTLEIASPTGMPESKRDEEIPEAKEEKSAGTVEGDMHADEEGLIGEEKIWKKIEAIRVIVGYKGPRRASYLEELKALYLFTGIEPPPSDSTAEFPNKLRFLMSVIGLK